MPPTLPSPDQAKVLRILQNQTVRAREMRKLESERKRLGEPSAPMLYQKMHRNTVLRHELQNAALAGGVPQTWLDHVRERGNKGLRWRSDLYLRIPEPVDRDHLLGALRAEAHRIRTHIATAIGFGHIGAAREVGTANAFDRNLRTLWTRTAAVTALLTDDTEEIAQIWGHKPNWQTTVTSALATTGPELLAQQWRGLAREDTSSYKQQADVLASAGITIDNTPIPAPNILVAEFRPLLQNNQEPLPSGKPSGNEIAAAIDAMDPARTDQPYQPGSWASDNAALPGPQEPQAPDAGRGP